jgi:hypothetical protein
MLTRAATIDAGGGPAAERVDAPARGGAMRFVYASGARPLEGFTIKRGIGRGGFGEVYFATSDAGKEVALKHIERNLEVELRGVGQCLNLKHPNLIDLYDIRYDDQGDAWVVMEYVAGSSLKETIDRNPNGLPLEQVNFVKIGDYGLSKFISCSRRSGQTESVGTFHYMAPEIGKGVYGKEIDIYALGVVLYEMITGRVPFDGESSQEIIMKHLTADPDLSAVPQPYRSIIERALRKDPAQRFHSAAEMVALFSNTPAGTKPGSGAAPLPIAFAAQAEPVYIGDDSEGIELGPLQFHPENAALAAEVLRGSGPAHHEPIARAAGAGWRSLAHWWNHGPLTTPLKIGILVIVALAAVLLGPRILPLALVLGSVYLIYLGLRLLAGSLRAPAATPAPAPPTSPHDAAPRSPGGRPLTWEQEGRRLLCEKTAGDCVGELAGSMLAAAAIAGVLAVVMAAIGGESLDDSALPLAGPAWLWLMTTLGAWLVLAAGKWCERSSGEMVKRRFGMLVLGLVFGAIAFATSQHLMVALHDGVIARGLAGNAWLRNMYELDGAPRLTAFLAYFGAVFLTVRWWKQCDPLRPSRLRIGPILIAVLAAWIWHLLWPFPQPWGFMLVAAISIATQLSAPWLSPAERTARRL